MRLLSLLLCTTFLFVETVCCKAAPALELHIDDIAKPGEIHIRITNKASQAINLWDESNSWGYGCWRILIINGASIDIFYPNPSEDFTMNEPTFHTIKSQGNLLVTLDLKDKSWVSSKGMNGNLKSGDVIVVIYDVQTSYEGRKRNVWSGVVVDKAQVK